MKLNSKLPTTILFSLFVSAGTVSAQEESEYPQCETNSGISGTLFKGHFGTVTAPRNFGTVAIGSLEGTGAASRGNQQIEVFPGSLYRQEMLVFAWPNAQADKQTTIYFIDNFDRMKSACRVSVIPFTPGEHDFAQTQVGYCQFGQRDGISQLTAGESKVFQVFEDYLDGATSAPRVLDYRPLNGGREIQFMAKSAGYATFTWQSEDNGNGTLKGLCPFLVTAAD